MITSTKEGKRTKVNYMVNNDLLVEMNKWIVPGERSNFVNGALEEAVLRFKRQKAFSMMDELREKANIRMSTKEMLKRKNYGRP